MYSSPLDMVDEWDESSIEQGKSFANNNFSSFKDDNAKRDRNINNNEEDDDEDSGWQGSSADNNNNNNNRDNYGKKNNDYGGGGGGSSRGGQRGGRSFGGERGRRGGGGGDGGYKHFGNNNNDDGESSGTNRGNRDGGGGGGGGGGGWQGGGDSTGENGYRNKNNSNGYRGNRNNHDENGEGNGGGWGGGEESSGGGWGSEQKDEGGFGGGRGRRGGGGGGRGGYRSGGFGDRDNNENDENDGEGGFGGGGRENRRGGRGGGGGGGGRGGGFGGGGRPNDNNDGEAVDGEKFQSDKPQEFYIPPEPTNDENEIFGTGITSGINFEKYDKIPIKVTGEPKPPPPIVTFELSGLKEFLLNNVRRSGYTIPTPIQKAAIPIIMGKRDLMGCAQTGSGKTAAFLLPIINELLVDEQPAQVGKPHVVILSPTRELAIQIFNEARKFALGSILKVCIVYGGTASRHQNSNLSRGCHILVCTPGRLLDFVDKTYVTFDDVRFVVLDEADRMLDMGFMPDITKMMNHPTMPDTDNRRTLMFSATFPEDIQRLAGQFLNNYVFVAIGIIGGACADVQQNIYDVPRFEKRKKLIEILNEGDPSGTMVFVETKKQADFLASYLSEANLPTTSIHGNRLQRQREEALVDFKQNRMKILVGTSVAARGLDLKNVLHVINFDLPNNIDEYVHRIGRTGRVGNQGKSTSFYDSQQDSALAQDLIKILQQAGQKVPEFLESGGGGGPSGNNDYDSRNAFGGRDVRSKREQQQFEVAPMKAQEPEEAWD